MEQPPGDPSHENQRNEHRHQRQTDGYDGETDLLGAMHRGFQGGLPLFHMADDIFDHHDRIVDHEPNRNRQRHQRKIIDRVAHRPHRRERAAQRKRHRHRRRDRRHQPAHENQHHHQHQRDRDQQRPLHVADAGPNGHCAVADDRHREPARQPAHQLRQQVFDAVDGFDDIGAGRLRDGQQNGRLRAVPSGQAGVGHAVGDLRDVPQPKDRALRRTHDQRPVFRRLRYLAIEPDRFGSVGPLEIAQRTDRVGVTNDGGHILPRQSGSREPLGVQRHPHGWLFRPVHRDLGHTLHLRQPLRQHGIGGIVDLRGAQRVGR